MKVTDFREYHPLVSVVIITRNRPEHVQECLSHLLKQDYQPFETIVADSSTDETTKRLIDADFGQVKYLHVEKARNNMPKSRNVGIDESRGEILAFIDDDCLVQEGWLRNVVACYGPDSSIGGVGGRVIDKHYPPDDHTPIGKVLPDGSRTTNFGRETAETCQVDWIPGNSMSFRKDVLLEIGPFDENLTITNDGEDLDMCIRVGRAGYKIMYCSTARLVHKSIRRSEGYSYMRPLTHYSMTRNKVYLMIKNWGFRKEWMLAILYGDTRGILMCMLRKMSWNNLTCLCANICGKTAGLIAGTFRKRRGQLRHEKP